MSGRPRPPRLWGVLARLLLRGESGPFVRDDIEGSFARDVRRGMPRGRASRRYALNLLGSTRSVWTGGVRRLVTHGVGLDAKLGVRMLACAVPMRRSLRIQPTEALRES